MQKFSFINQVVIYLLLALLSSYNAWADFTLEFDPVFFVEERYDDNIYLTRSNTRSDWITTLSPGFLAALANPRIRGELEYHAGFVYFLHNPEFDYTGHDLEFNGSVDITPRLTFSLFESYVRSNEPDLTDLADTEAERDLRRGRAFTFNRHIIAPQFEYRFSRENLIRLHYRNTNYRDEDPLEDDYRENYIECMLDYWFTMKNGITLSFNFTKGNFDIDSDLHYAIDISPRYRYRIHPHFELYAEYGYVEADFEKRPIIELVDDTIEIQRGVEDIYDHNIHRGAFGFRWQPYRNITVEGKLGYFWLQGAGKNDEQGIISLLAIEKAFRHTTFRLGWESGYREDYFSLRDSGFIEFWELSSHIVYDYQEKLQLMIRGSYGYDDYAIDRGRITFQDREDYRYTAEIQLTYNILRNFGKLSELSLELNFLHRELDSNLKSEYYINNRALGRITATF